MQHRLHRALFRAEAGGGVRNALTDTRPAILVPSETCPLPMTELGAGMEIPTELDDIRICRWKEYYELEKQVMAASTKKYTLVLPHHAVMLRPPRPSDIPDDCQLFIMGTLQPEFPYEGGIMREIQRDNKHGSCWWCPHMGAWFGLTATARVMARGAMAREWTAQFHHALRGVACVDRRCALFQDLSLAHPLVEGLPAALPPLMPHALSVVIYAPGGSGAAAAVPYACRAACQYHSLGYRDITVCHAAGHAFPVDDVPWVRAVPVPSADAALLQAAGAPHPAVLFHYDNMVPSQATVDKLHACWARAPRCLHSLLGTVWADGHAYPIDTTKTTVPCTVIEPHCFMVARRRLRHYFALLTELHQYHALTRGQFPEVGLSWALGPPHQAHPRLCSTLEHNGLRESEGVPDSAFQLPEVEDVVYDTWMRACAAYHQAGTSPTPATRGGAAAAARAPGATGCT